MLHRLDFFLFIITTALLLCFFLFFLHVDGNAAHPAPKNLSSTTLGGVPRGLMWLFDALSHPRICSCCQKTKGAKTVSLVTDTSQWLMQPQCGTVAPHPHPPGQDQLPSLHISQWPETKRGREAKKETPTISSIFLMNPIFCPRAQGMFVRPWHL